MTLLAKSKNLAGDTLSLLRHLRETREAVDLLFAPDSRWRQSWLRFFQIGDGDAKEFWTTLRVAAVFHDIGKANADFQRAVTIGAIQSIRHEHLSALVLCLPEWRAWLSRGDVDPDLVIATVLSHHIKAQRTGDYQWCASRGSEAVELHLDDPDVGDALKEVSSLLGLPDHPAVPEGPFSPKAPWRDALEDGIGAATRLTRLLKKDLPRRRFLAALKAGLVVADSVASAMFRTGKTILIA